MAELQLRTMTEAEFEEYLRHAISGYAAAPVSAGSWSKEEAEERAAADTAKLLPAGLATEDMPFYRARAMVAPCLGPPKRNCAHAEFLRSL